MLVLSIVERKRSVGIVYKGGSMSEVINVNVVRETLSRGSHLSYSNQLCKILLHFFS